MMWWNIFPIGLGLTLIMACMLSQELARGIGGRIIGISVGILAMALGTFLLLYPPKPLSPYPKAVISTDIWYQGGTLHQAQIQEWLNANFHNRRATAHDLIEQFRNQEKLDIKIYSQEDIKPWATALDMCIREKAKAMSLSQKQQTVIDLAQKCVNKRLIELLNQY